MAFKKKVSLEAESTIRLGGRDNNGKPNPTSIEGYYLGSRAVEGDMGTSYLHVFQTKNGNVGVWGKTKLNSLLTSDLVGMMVQATFTGMGKAKKGRNAPYNYEVQYDEENTIDVSGLAAATNEAVEDDYVAEDDTTYADDDGGEADVMDDDSALDEVPPPRTVTAPKKPLATPDASRQARVKQLLVGKR